MRSSNRFGQALDNCNNPVVQGRHICTTTETSIKVLHSSRPHVHLIGDKHVQEKNKAYCTHLHPKLLGIIHAIHGKMLLIKIDDQIPAPRALEPGSADARAGSSPPGPCSETLLEGSWPFVCDTHEMKQDGAHEPECINTFEWLHMPIFIY